MATITSAGIGSGLDVESLITKLMAVERQPIQQIQDRISGLKTQLSAYGKLQSTIANLRDAALKLTRSETFGAAAASSSDSTIASGVAAIGSTAGSYAVKVNQLASAQSIATPATPSGASLGTGTIQIDFGKYVTDAGTGDISFDTDPARTSLIIPVTTGEAELNQIRDKINAMKAGIVASVVSDANGSRLVMRSVASGAANAFRVTVADDDFNPVDNVGLSALAYDASTASAVNTANLKQAAANAKATIDGIDIESATNTVSGAVEGLTLTLGKVSPDAATITVSQDKASLKKSISDFVAAYNDSVKLLRDDVKYDSGSKNAGPLQGDSTAVGLQNQLRSIISSTTTLGGTLTRFAEIGLDPQGDGTLKINDTKLEAALAQPSDLKNFFAGLDSANPANNGLAQQLRELGDSVLSIDGRLDSRQKGLQSRIDSNNKRGDALNLRLELVEKRLRAQYTALDQNVGKMQGLSQYLTQQLQKL